MSELIGEPTRAKWRAFLDRALDLEYIDPEEYTERMEALLKSRTMSDIQTTATNGFSKKNIETWNDEWDKRRKKGLALPNKITPAPLPARRESINVDAFLADAVVALCIIGWVAFILVFTGVI